MESVTTDCETSQFYESAPKLLGVAACFAGTLFEYSKMSYQVVSAGNIAAHDEFRPHFKKALRGSTKFT